MKNKTIIMIMITHRLTSIENADIIYVLDKGHISQKWNHQQLISRNGVYKTIMNK